jgi:hypothetical protein
MKNTSDPYNCEAFPGVRSTGARDRQLFSIAPRTMLTSSAMCFAAACWSRAAGAPGGPHLSLMWGRQPVRLGRTLSLLMLVRETNMNTDIDEKGDTGGLHWAGTASMRTSSLGSRWTVAVKALVARICSVGDWQFRDPRLDSLRGCLACHGTGVCEHDPACGHCSGTGRIRLGNTSSPDAGRGR